MAEYQLFDADGNRKYLTPSERDRFEAAAQSADGVTGTFCMMGSSSTKSSNVPLFYRYGLGSFQLRILILSSE